MSTPETATEFLQLLREETKKYGGMDLEKVRGWGFLPSAAIMEFRRRGYELAVQDEKLVLIRERRITARMNARRYPQQQLFEMPRQKKQRTKGFAESENE